MLLKITNALYGRLDFGHDFDNGISLEGNFGLRYVETTDRSWRDHRLSVP